MAKVALIQLYSPSAKSIPPLASLYLATALQKNGHSAKIIHVDANRMDKVLAEVEKFSPDLVGMSVFTGYHNKKYVELSRTLKREGYKIIWGNAHAALLPEQVLSDPAVDFVCLGEGEGTLCELAGKLGQKEVYKDIAGLGFKNDNGGITINPKRDFIDIDDYLIDWDLIDMEKYVVPYYSNKYKRTLAITTSRGCPFNCQFCYNLVFNNRRWRGHDAEKFVRNIMPVIEKYRIDSLRFLDDNFFVNKTRAFGIIKALKLPYSAEARVEYVDDAFVDELKKTGCIQIMFGFESGSERILNDVVKKGITVSQIKNAVKSFKDTGIMASGSFVFGFPSETEAEYKKTMGFIVELLELNNNLSFTTGWFLPYAGTGLYDKAKEYGFNPPEKTEDWDKYDRWKKDYTMEWLDWDYTQAVKYSRQTVLLLSGAYKKNVPVLRQILKWRVKSANFVFPADIHMIKFFKNTLQAVRQRN